MPTSTSRSRSSTRRWPKPLAASLAALAALGCPAGPPAPLPSPPAPGAAEPELRVGIVVGAEQITLGGDGELILSAGATAGPVGVVPMGSVWMVTGGADGLRLTGVTGAALGPYRVLSAVNVTEGRFVAVNGRRYRGRLEILARDGRVTAVNRVLVEGYLAAVVGGEMGRRRPEEREALLAQAVVSRTFAWRNRGRWESFGFDAYGDVRDQAYGGVASESPESWEAARRTAGQVLAYGGEVIDAFFHSTCGFSTAAVEEAFRTARSRPYLRAVSDARRGGGYYCDISPRFRWREEWDGPALRAILSQTLPSLLDVGSQGLQPVADVSVGHTTRSGRVGELVIAFPQGEVRVPGALVRQVLAPAPDRWLGSAAVQLHVTREGGRVTRLVAAGAGWGHGVGMCQWGAVGRARAGLGHREILETYFPGTTIARMY